MAACRTMCASFSRSIFSSYLRSKEPANLCIRARYSVSTSSAEAAKNADEVPPISQTPESTDIDPTLKALQEENTKLLGHVKELDDKYKRSLAEMENVRQRMTRQIDEARVFGIQKFCKDLLDVADVLQTATVSVPADAIKSDGHLKNLYEGLKMTESQLQSVFRRHGLTQINPIGAKFDPNEHEAVFMAEDPSKEPGTVAVVSKLGYKLKDRTIRPAVVGVVKQR